MADTLLPTLMFLFAHPHGTLLRTNFASEAQKMFLISCKKHFVSARNIFSFARARKPHEQQYFHQNCPRVVIVD